MFNSQRLTLRAATIISLLFLGLVGLVLLFFSTEIYRDMVLNNERENLRKIIEIESKEISENHFFLVTKMAGHLGLEQGFQQAVQKQDKNAIEHLLNEQFFQYYVTANVIALNHLAVIDPSYELIGQSSQRQLVKEVAKTCPKFYQHIQNRTGINRIKPEFQLCSYRDTPLMIGVFPVGTFRPKGYIITFSEIPKDFQAIESDLGMPISISTPADKTTYQSENWNTLEQQKDILIANYTQRNDDNEEIIKIRIARDFSTLGQDLNTLRTYSMLFGTLVTLIAIMLSLFFLTRSALNPLTKLNQHMRALRSDKNRLGETVNIVANPEIMELADNYNDFSKDLKEAYDSLEKMAYTDPLTTLPNRSQLQKQLDYYTSQVVDRDLPFSLFLMDLDRFKEINDTLGHQAGDTLLQEVSARLQRVLRKTDVITFIDEDYNDELLDVARLGGDEFAMLLPSVGSKEDAQYVAEKILKEMSGSFEYENHHFNVGISIGIVLAPIHGIEGHILLRKADIAMYHAKKNQLGYAFYEQAADQHSIETLSLDRDIKIALEKDEFELFYQPKIDLKSEKIIGVEALIRWFKDDGSLVMPDQFIPYSEQVGSIHDITRWVVGAACKQLNHWQTQNIPLSISINLSPKSLYSKDLSEHVLECLNNTKVDPQKLFLEITESSIMSDPQRSIHILQRIHAKGIRISIDDFGTGYSSLSKLKALPIDEIKIDRSFVMDMMNDNNDEIIVRSIIDLSRNMGLQVIAEGVEDEDTLQKLKEFGCTEAQGYHMGKPMSRSDLEVWLKKSKWCI